MALTPAEKQKAYRERKRAEKRTESLAATASSTKLFKAPFSESAYDDPNFSNFELSLALIGIEAPQFETEDGPHKFAFEEALGHENPFPGAEGAIGRAEVMIGCLLDAALELAGVVNTYKRREIKQRLRELEEPEVMDRQTAMKEAVRLNKILDQLDKQVRRSFPQWEIAGK